MKHAFPLCLILAAGAVHASEPAANGLVSMGGRRPVVLELFTSQGCSSCPPADALIAEYRDREDLIVLTLHVDYWDSLGWRDPFALPLSAQRQRRYAERLSPAGSYTPQLIIDGRSSGVGSNRALVSGLPHGGVAGTTVALTRSSEGVAVALPDVTTAKNLRVYVVPYRDSALTAVGRGENGGRKLQEYHIVRDLVALGRTHGGAETFSYARSRWPADSTHLAVLLQADDGQPIEGAAQIRLRP